MSRMNGTQVRWCDRCNGWFSVAKTEMGLVPCPQCGQVPNTVRCNRCGHEWRLKGETFPKNCTACKSPYFNRIRMQDRPTERMAKRKDR